MILCGGRGGRLQPLTANLPKPLVALNGRPILQHVIEFYLSQRCREFVLCVGFRAEMIEAFVEQQQFPARIVMSNAGEEASMLRRLYEARASLADRAIVTYGDTFLNINLQHLLAAHVAQRVAITMTIADIRSPFGLVAVDEDQRVSAFQEKPVLPYYIGQLVLERRVLDELDPSLLALPDGEGLVRLFQQLIAQRQLAAYKHEGLQITFNTLAEREKAEEEMLKFYTAQEQERTHDLAET